MRRLLALLLLVPAVLSAQKRVILPATFVEPEVRTTLNKDWVLTPGQHERAYCVRFVTATDREGTPQYTLVEAWRAEETNTGPMSIENIKCPEGADITYLHVHPPHTDLDDIYPSDTRRKPHTFVAGGVESYQCGPSPTDVASMVFETKHPFELIMCAPDALVPYYRQRYKIVEEK